MRLFIEAPLVVVLSGVLLVTSLPAVEPQEQGQKKENADDDVSKQAAQERKEKFTTWMRNFAEGTKILDTQPTQDRQQAAKLVANPVFRYSDEERFIPDATLWVWTRDGRPAAFQKVEGNNHGGGQMTKRIVAKKSAAGRRGRRDGK